MIQAPVRTYVRLSEVRLLVGLGPARDGARERSSLDTSRLVELALLALAFVALLVLFRSFADDTAGGSDSYGYVSEAIRLSQGHFYEPEHVLSRFGLAEDSSITHPLGYIGHGAGGTIPTYPFGFPLLIVLAMKSAGFLAAFWVTPVLGAFTVLLTYLLARDQIGPVGGIVAAALTLALPNFLFFVVQPMSDVPAAFFGVLALWALIRRRENVRNDLILAFAVGLGIWIRPNLALVVVPILAWLVWRGEFRRTARFVALLLPFVVVEGAVNLHLYGAPWTTGYGDPPLTHNLTDALQRCGRYLIRLNSQQAGIGLALVGFGVAFGKLDWRVRALFIGFASVLLAFFSFYSIDDAWWYGRFLLPGLAPVAIVEASGVVRVLDLTSRRWIPAPFLLVLAVLFGWQSLSFDRANGVFEIGQGELKYQKMAQLVSRTVDGRSLVLANQHSGSIRLYAGVPTMRYDLAPVSQLMGILQQVTAVGGTVYLVGEDWEVKQIKNSDRAVLLVGAQALGTVEPSDVTLFRLDILPPANSSVPHPLDVIFGNQIVLRGFKMSPEHPKPGDVVTVTLYWTALREPDANYSVFVHLERNDKSIIAQLDSFPMGGTYPTSAWVPGYTVPDVHQFKIPTGTPSQPAHLTAGLYRLDTLERLPPRGTGVPPGGSDVDLQTMVLPAG